MGIIAVATVLHLGTAFSNPGVSTVTPHRPSVTRVKAGASGGSTRPAAGVMQSREGGEPAAATQLDAADPSGKLRRCVASGRVSEPSAHDSNLGGADVDAVVVLRLRGPSPIKASDAGGQVATAWAVTYALAAAATSRRVVAEATTTNATLSSGRVGLVVQCAMKCDRGAVTGALRAVLAAPAWPRTVLLALAYGSAIPADGATVVLYEADSTACTHGVIVAVTGTTGTAKAAAPSALFGGSSAVAQRVRTLTWKLFSRRPGVPDEDAADSIARHAEQRSRKSFHDHGALRVMGVVASSGSGDESSAAVAWLTAGASIAFADGQREVARGIQWLAEHVDASTFARFSLARIEGASGRPAATTTDLAIPARLAGVFRDLTRTDVLILPAGAVFGAIAALTLPPGSAVVELNVPGNRPLHTADIFGAADVSATTLLLPADAGEPKAFVACADALDACPWGVSNTSTSSHLARYHPSGSGEGMSPVADTSRTPGGGRGACVDARWYHAFKTAVGTVWLWRSRIRDIHAFDTRR